MLRLTTSCKWKHFVTYGLRFFSFFFPRASLLAWM